jgi:hypothetical protein
MVGAGFDESSTEFGDINKVPVEFGVAAAMRLISCPECALQPPA